MPPWCLITPASRGIGLELARRVLRTTGLPVVATARQDLDQVREAILTERPLDSFTDPEIKGRRLTEEQAKVVAGEGDGSRLTVLRLDVKDEDSIATAADECKQIFQGGSSSQQKQNYLQLAMVLPGILHPEKSPAQLEHDAMLDTFRVNTIGPMLVMKHFAPFLPRKSTPQSLGAGEAGFLRPDTAIWATWSARVGSISDNGLGGWYSYRASKAAVNQVTKSFDNYLRATSGARAMAVGVHPGTVRTGLSRDFWANVRDDKLLRAEFAAERLCSVLGGLETGESRGRCWDWKGDEVPP